MAASLTKEQQQALKEYRDEELAYVKRVRTAKSLNETITNEEKELIQKRRAEKKQKLVELGLISSINADVNITGGEINSDGTITPLVIADKTTEKSEEHKQNQNLLNVSKNLEKEVYDNVNEYLLSPEASNEDFNKDINDIIDTACNNDLNYQKLSTEEKQAIKNNLLRYVQVKFNNYNSNNNQSNTPDNYDEDDIEYQSSFFDNDDPLFYNKDLPDNLKIDKENDSKDVIRAKQEAILNWYRDHDPEKLPRDIRDSSVSFDSLNLERLTKVGDQLFNYVTYTYQGAITSSLQNGKILSDAELTDLISNVIDKVIETYIYEYDPVEKRYVKNYLKHLAVPFRSMYENLKNKIKPINKDKSGNDSKTQQVSNVSDWIKTNMSFSGTDMVLSADMRTTNGQSVSMVVGSVQSFSYSIYRKLNPIYCIGNINAKDYVGGPRTIAGSIVFTVFNQHWGTELMNKFFEAEGYAANRKILMDEIAPINFTISMANEYGFCSRLAIYGVRLFSEGQVMSINDIYTENTYQYVATNIDYLVDINSNKNFALSNKYNPTSQSAPDSTNYGTNGSVTQKPANKAEDAKNVDKEKQLEKEMNELENDELELQELEDMENQNSSEETKTANGIIHDIQDKLNKKDDRPMTVSGQIINFDKYDNKNDCLKMFDEDYQTLVKEINDKLKDTKQASTKKDILDKAKVKYYENKEKIEKHYIEKVETPGSSLPSFEEIQKSIDILISQNLPDYRSISTNEEYIEKLNQHRLSILQKYKYINESEYDRELGYINVVYNNYKTEAKKYYDNKVWEDQYNADKTIELVSGLKIDLSTYENYIQCLQFANKNKNDYLEDVYKQYVNDGLLSAYESKAKLVEQRHEQIVKQIIAYYEKYKS